MAACCIIDMPCMQGFCRTQMTDAGWLWRREQPMGGCSILWGVQCKARFRARRARLALLCLLAMARCCWPGRDRERCWPSAGRRPLTDQARMHIHGLLGGGIACIFSPSHSFLSSPTCLGGQALHSLLDPDESLVDRARGTAGKACAACREHCGHDAAGTRGAAAEHQR